MSWTWVIDSGEMLANDGSLLAKGYAGHEPHVNDPGATPLRNVGPLPQGRYLIGAPFNDPKTGPYSLHLEPNLENVMYGRSGFRIHGDSIKDPGCASEGCIILNRESREKIWTSGDQDLTVIPSRVTLLTMSVSSPGQNT